MYILLIKNMNLSIYIMLNVNRFVNFLFVLHGIDLKIKYPENL